MAIVSQLVIEPTVIRSGPVFDEFYRREYREVLGLAFVLCRNRSAAEELAQEAFLAAFKRWDEVSQMESPEGWVRKVVANRAASRFRRVAAEARALTRLGRRDSSPDVGLDTIAVCEAVRRLSTRQAEVIVLVYFAGLSHDASAQVMGCSVETVRTHLDRAKKRLAGYLGVEP
ncbi:MAG: sigma-70 family RNA polymerase sigma factor [Actinomycetota bacterium]